MLLFVQSEAVVSKLVKLETSRTVLLPSTVSVLWIVLKFVPTQRCFNFCCKNRRKE